LRWDLASRAMSLGRSRVCLEMADACRGSRDVFAVVEVAESQELNELVMDTIQRPERVAGTGTHIALNFGRFREHPRTPNLFDKSLWDEPWMISATKYSERCNRWF